MKQKIVIKVPMQSDKDKSKAMQIAVTMQGVSSVSIGKEGDRIEVIGEGVDSVCLAKSLRKKFCFADIVSVGEVKPVNPPQPTPPFNYYYPPPCPQYYNPCPVYDTGSPSWFFM
ncbi:hypothetical protein ABFS82_13G153400 [Erythranthe guttata]|uniref:HMA domain-containing protein n=1 Tax=Erythranthe guttata TaxID=4155 RepID=A0A022QJR6_ERYGU|nr:hypothetical protein MIMGU_mgv1a016643mg [Erythranthe guttata]